MNFEFLNLWASFLSWGLQGHVNNKTHDVPNPRLISFSTHLLLMKLKIGCTSYCVLPYIFSPRRSFKWQNFATIVNTAGELAIFGNVVKGFQPALFEFFFLLILRCYPCYPFNRLSVLKVWNQIFSFCTLQNLHSREANRQLEEKKKNKLSRTYVDFLSTALLPTCSHATYMQASQICASLPRLGTF